MPKITYKPDGVDTPKVWEVSFGKFMSAERIVIERESGSTWAEVKQRFFNEDTVLIRAFLYILLKRDMPTLKIDQVEFCEDDYELDATDEERAQAIEALEGLESKGGLSDDARDALDSLRAEREERGPKDSQPANTKPSGSAT